MIVAMSMLTLVLGGGLACAADHVPSRVVALESWGGTLLVAGLALLGAGMPLFR